MKLLFKQLFLRRVFLLRIALIFCGFGHQTIYARGYFRVLGAPLVAPWRIAPTDNADSCKTHALMRDKTSVCSDTGLVTIAGTVGYGPYVLEDASVTLQGFFNGVPSVFIQSGGKYEFSNALPVSSDAIVTPALDLDPLNGVNTWDLILISRHILAVELLNTPYKLIAADANKSGTVTAFDIVELRKLILGTYQQLPSNTSWRFVDQTQVFTNPIDPFTDGIRETLEFFNIQNDITNGDFIGVKIGDVDGTATPNNLVSSDDRTDGTLLLDLEDRMVNAGETFAVTFTADQVVKGYQFTLNLDGLKVESIIGEGMSEEHFAVFSNAITTSWDAPVTFNGKAAFTVTFTATKNGKLSEMLSVSSRITKALAFLSTSPDESRKLGVALRFNNGGSSSIAGQAFELYQNVPNPWVDQTVIGFYLPEAGTVNFQLYDMSGKILYRTLGDFSQGYHSLNIGKNMVQNNCVLYYSASYNGMNIVRKMIKFD